MDILHKVYYYINNPKIALIVIFILILGYFLSIGLTVGFANNFISFGPTKDVEGEPITFMGIKLDSWEMVIIAYVIIFMSTLLSSYYSNIINKNISVYVWNAAIETIPYSKLWTYIILLVDPLIDILLYIIRFYAAATFQIQYIIPQFIADYLINLPFTLKWLSNKTFTNV